jgi:hypothetical protein
MDDATMTPDQPAQTMPETPPTPTTEEGYRLHFDVTAEGYEVSDPQPLPPSSPGEEQGEGQPDPDLASALKHVVAIVKANPRGEGEQEQFTAGYEHGRD